VSEPDDELTEAERAEREAERPRLHLATAIVLSLMQAQCNGPEGCFTLATAYGLWLAEHPEAEPDTIDAMFRVGAEHARHVFDLMRQRKAERDATD
jgi:hypothetical protein